MLASEDVALPIVPQCQLQFSFFWTANITNREEKYYWKLLHQKQMFTMQSLDLDIMQFLQRNTNVNEQGFDQWGIRRRKKYQSRNQTLLI